MNRKTVPNPEPYDKALDLSNFLLLRKSAKTIVTTPEGFDLKRFKCRPIPYVGVCIDSVESASACLSDLCAGDVIIGVDGESMHLVSMNELKNKTSKANGTKLTLTVTPVSAAKPILDDLNLKKIEGKKEIDKQFQNQKLEDALSNPPPERNTATDLSILYRLKYTAKTVIAPSRSLGITCRCVPFVGIYIDSVKTTSSLHAMIHSGDIIIAVNGRSTHLSSIVEVISMLSTDVGLECHLSVVPASEARPLLEALYRKNMDEKKKLRQFFGTDDPMGRRKKHMLLKDQSTTEGDEAMDLTVTLRLKKVAKTIVAPNGGLGWVCRSIPYVGICVEEVQPTSPLLNIVCKGDVIIAVNEQSTQLASINDFIAMASKVDDSSRFFTVAPAWIAQSILESADLSYTETKGWSRKESKRVDFDSHENAFALGDHDEIISTPCHNRESPDGRTKGVHNVEPCKNIEAVREELERPLHNPKVIKRPSKSDANSDPQDRGSGKRNAPLTPTVIARSNKTSFVRKDVQFSDHDGTLPEGWKLELVKRMSGKHVDRYWYTKTQKKLRSKIEVFRFLVHCKTTDGDEDLAFDLLRGKKVKLTPKKRSTPTNNKQTLTQTDKRRRSNGEEDVRDAPDAMQKTTSKDINSKSNKETVEKPRESKMRRSPGVPNAKQKTSSKDMDSNSNKETVEDPKESERRKSPEISDAKPKTTSKDNDSNFNQETVENPRESKRRKSNVEEDTPDIPDAEKIISKDKESDSNKQTANNSLENRPNEKDDVTDIHDATKKAMPKANESDSNGKTAEKPKASKNKESTVEEDVTDLPKAEETSNTKKIILNDNGSGSKKDTAENLTQMSNEETSELNRPKRMRRQTLDEIAGQNNGLNRELRKRSSRSSLPLSYAS